MRDNGTVTTTEVELEDGDELVSATDTKGRITFCNQTFCRIAGFEQEELLHKAHNVVRHIDMPPAAFQLLWDRLKNGDPWMGIVKNRCKNGDYYWVDAYVTPLKSNGMVTGYESVRAKADKATIARAEQTYQRINKGLSPFPLLQIWWHKTSNLIFCSATVLVLMLVCIAYFAEISLINMAIVLSLSLIGGGLGQWLIQHRLKAACRFAKNVIDDPLAAYIYTGRCDPVGNIELAFIAQQSRLRTALGRMAEASREVMQRSGQARGQVQRSHEDLIKQQQETEQVASSMHQMAQAVQEVAASASDTSGATSNALAQVGEGTQVLDQASGALQSLSKTVVELGTVVENLSSDSAEIASVVGVIRGIAEQTNLLALNAAIEAARAGEQGRGFAVVADEVRTLASRTQESTQHIENIIENLGKATKDAAINMAECQTRANKCVAEMSHVKNALGEITQSVGTIDQMSERIAVSSEQQSAVAAEIERTIQAISQISTRTQSEVASADQLSQEVAEHSENQLQLVERFN